MARQITTQEAKELPVWPEMNRYIKQILREEVGTDEYTVVNNGNVWEIWVGDKLIGEIGVLQHEEGETEEDKSQLN